jgi:hypothetical protein
MRNRSVEGNPEGEPLATITVEFYPSPVKDKAIGGVAISWDMADQFRGRLSHNALIRNGINALLDVLEGLTSEA